MASFQLQRFNRWLASLSAAYALVAVVYFFANFASNVGWPVRELLPSMVLSLVLAVGSFLIMLVATGLAVDRRVQVAIATTTAISLLIAVPLYAGAFYPGQDGEFSAAFVLVGLPTTCVALLLAVFAVLARGKRRLPSNPLYMDSSRKERETP